MKRFNIRAIAVAAAFAAIPLAAQAADDEVGTCGWGSKLFEGQSGLGPKVLAVTTNGTLGNQTFAISSGTSGCTQDGTVRSSWKLAAFIDDSEMDVLSYMDFPAQHRAKLHSTNSLERLNKEVKLPSWIIGEVVAGNQVVEWA
jgi:hypothetical protein